MGVQTESEFISLIVNGVAYKVKKHEYPASTTLLQYLRSTGISTGTKGCCYQGGCGVCVVTLAQTSCITGKVKHCSVNSCCMLLYTCDGMEVTTVEGLGSVSTGLHAIQDRLAKYDGAQCGYCSPGQVMNMHALLKENPRPEAREVEDAFDTTICRCTGYRSIMDAMKSFARDTTGDLVDIEELSGKLCAKTGQACRGQCKEKPEIKTGELPGSVWLSPETLNELYSILGDHKHKSYRLVFGNTGFGVYKELGVWNYETLIDVHGIRELYTIDTSSADNVVLGANLTLSELIVKLENGLNFLMYADVLIKHLKFVASTAVRNAGTWAGNVMVKHRYPDFASDVFTLLETFEATLSIGSEKGVEQVSLSEFMEMSMLGKVILSVQLPKYSSSGLTRVFRTFRTSHRLQACEASVVSGFNFALADKENYMIGTEPVIVLQLIGNKILHCRKTSQLLTGKQLSQPQVLKDAVKVLSEEIADGVKSEKNKEYLSSLAICHFYKFVLGVCKSKLPDNFLSGADDLERSVMSGTQDLGDHEPKTYPASNSVMNLVSPSLTTGEIKYLDDLRPSKGQLYAAPVLTTLARAKIGGIDPTAALDIPGVVGFLKASDITGINNWRPKGWYEPQHSQELLCSDQVLYAGQPLGILVADDELVARQAAMKVEVTYKDIEPAITDFKEAIELKRFFTKPRVFSAGDAQAAMQSSPHVLSGRIHTKDQYHFHLENEVAICSPTDTGGVKVKATTQWLDYCQGAVSQVLGLSDADVTVEVCRLGGAFGGKTVIPGQIAGMCALAARAYDAPTKMSLDLNTNMQMQGSRASYRFDYQVAFESSGKLIAVDLNVYSDSGAVFLPFDAEEGFADFVDNCYFCPNWSVKGFTCHTDRCPSAACRAPGTSQAIFAMESIMDHIATFLKLDHLAVRKLNFFTDNQKTMQGMLVENCLIGDVVSQLEQDVQYVERSKAIQDFNKQNRWKKRGLHVMPSLYSMTCAELLCLNTTVTVYHSDGSVVVTHGGVDMGQGMNTKAIQVCAWKLGVPLEKIRVAPSSTITSPNSWFTGGSVTSEIICMGIMKCCDDLNTRMQPVRDRLGDNPKWEELVKKSFDESIDLTGYYRSGAGNRTVKNYMCYSACCAEVELDVLTGQYQVTQVDYICDTGLSLNPRLDLGQLEGGFIMGCGLFLLESLAFEPHTGRPLSTGTWTYKPPMAKDLPIKFNAKLLRNAPNPKGVLGSKAVGETPVASGACPLFALKRAVEAARLDIGNCDWFPMDAPASVQQLHSLCSTTSDHLTLS